MLAGVLLAGPFVFVGIRIDLARRVPAARGDAIKHSDCNALRDQLDRLRLDADSDPSFDLAGSRGATMHLIVERGRKLRCRPELQTTSD